MFSNWVGYVFMTGQFLFMSKPPPSHCESPFCVFPSIHSVMLTSTSAQRHRKAAGEVELGGVAEEERHGMEGEGVGKRTGEGGNRREAQLQVWPKCHSPFHTHPLISSHSSDHLLSLLPLFHQPVILLKSLQSPAAPPSFTPAFISHVCFLSALWCERSLLVLHSSSPPQSLPHYDNFRFKCCHPLSGSDPVSAKLFSEDWAELLEYLMSPLGYDNHIHRLCLTVTGNTAHTVLKGTHNNTKTLCCQLFTGKLGDSLSNVVYRSSSQATFAIWGLLSLMTHFY